MVLIVECVSAWLVGYVCEVGKSVLIIVECISCEDMNEGFICAWMYALVLFQKCVVVALLCGCALFI